jgi:hypothetical protein
LGGTLISPSLPFLSDSPCGVLLDNPFGLASKGIFWIFQMMGEGYGYFWWMIFWLLSFVLLPVAILLSDIILL